MNIGLFFYGVGDASTSCDRCHRRALGFFGTDLTGGFMVGGSAAAVCIPGLDCRKVQKVRMSTPDRMPSGISVFASNRSVWRMPGETDVQKTVVRALTFSTRSSLVAVLSRRPFFSSWKTRLNILIFGTFGSRPNASSPARNTISARYIKCCRTVSGSAARMRTPHGPRTSHRKREPHCNSRELHEGAAGRSIDFRHVSSALVRVCGSRRKMRASFQSDLSHRAWKAHGSRMAGPAGALSHRVAHRRRHRDGYSPKPTI